MPTWLIIVLAVLLVLIAVLAVGGALAAGRREREGRAAFARHLDEVDRNLAAAHAEDKGWEPGGLEAAARAAFAEAHPGTEPGEVNLVQVVDEPGVESDRAVFRFGSGGDQRHLTLRRESGSWVSEATA